MKENATLINFNLQSLFSSDNVLFIPSFQLEYNKYNKSIKSYFQWWTKAQKKNLIQLNQNLICLKKYLRDA